ncbi:MULTISPECIES: hypothetical protein [Streptomyces]|uniref:Uncharacterized protein n=1 Tax=Streptomyces griseosporeus TaxID=1910 RepID=A0ABV3KYG9_STRGS|nr:hypothetical protein [Streptomyces actuosus]
MSTEARRAPVPPRPTAPPPGSPDRAPRPAPDQPDGSASDSGTARPGDARQEGFRAAGGTARPGTPADSALPEGARSAAPEDGTARTGSPAQPGRRPASSQGTAGTPGFGSFPAAGGAPQDPPPPPASARFPDAPPAAGRPGPGVPRPGAAGRAGDPAPQQGGVPRQPQNGTGAQPRPADGGAQPGRSTETPSETTTRLRPVPPDPHPARTPRSTTHPAAPSPSAPHHGTGPATSAHPGTGSATPARPGTAPSNAARPGAGSVPPARPGTAPGTSAHPGTSPGASARPGTGSTSSAHPAPAPATSARPGTGSVPSARPGPAPAHPDAPSAPSAAGPWAPLPHPTAPDPALSWSAPGAGVRPVVSFAEPERFDEAAYRVRRRRRGAAAAVCLVLGLGLIGGAVTGSWLTGDSGDRADADAFATAAELWHSVPVDELFPPTVQGQGAGPGAADRTWTRIAVAPDSGCAGAFDPLLAKTLAPVGCERLLRATYTDATQSYVTTVGLLFTGADADAMRTLRTRFDKEDLADRADLMPRPYAAKGTAADGFGDAQRASWTVSVLTDAPVVVYAVSGWADGRTVDTPQPAEEAAEPGATTAPAQAGLGNEAQGLADRIERGLRATASKPTEQPS